MFHKNIKGSFKLDAVSKAPTRFRKENSVKLVKANSRHKNTCLKQASSSMKYSKKVIIYMHTVLWVRKYRPTHYEFSSIIFKDSCILMHSRSFCMFFLGVSISLMIIRTLLQLKSHSPTCPFVVISTNMVIMVVEGWPALINYLGWQPLPEIKKVTAITHRANTEICNKTECH